MECSNCGSYNHNTAFCPGIRLILKRNEKGQYLCSKCKRPWGDNDYAIECCTEEGKHRK